MSDTIIYEVLLNAAKILAGIPCVMTHKLASLPVSQQLYDAAPPEWKPLLIVSEMMPEPTPSNAARLFVFRIEKDISSMFIRYQQHVATPSDIQHHLPLLYSLARGNVLELGTRTGVSTAALLAGVERHGGHVWSVDLDDCSAVAAGHRDWTFIQADSCDTKQIDVFGKGCIDLLLIDTEHTLERATQELATWAEYIAPGGHICMHDPETFPGVRRAAQEFADAHGWPITFVLPCNGMAVIRRPD